MKQLLFPILFLTGFCYAYDPSTDRILCIVNYNWAHYQSMPLIKQFYGTFFPHMVFYGPKRSQMHFIDHSKGYFGYKVLADAMEKYPDYDGYLFMNDDCMMNIWNFRRFDCSKLWFTYSGKIPFSVHLKKTGWPWWATSMGVDALEKSLKHLPETYKKQLVENLGPGNVTCAASDVVYIPQRLRKDCIVMCNLFATYKLFLEVAVPLICACIEPGSNWEQFKTLYLWGNDRRLLADKYSTGYDFVHPVKLSEPAQVLFVKQKLAAYYT